MNRVVKIMVHASSKRAWNSLPWLRVGPLLLTGRAGYGSQFMIA